MNMSIRKFVPLKQSWALQVVKDVGLEPRRENWFEDLSVFMEVRVVAERLDVNIFLN